MVEIKYNGDVLFGDLSHSGRLIRPGETLDVDEDDLDRYLNHRSGNWERVNGSDSSVGDSLGSEGDDTTQAEETDSEATEAPSERTEAEQLSDLNWRNLRDAIEDGEADDMLDALEFLEYRREELPGNKTPRNTILTAIENRKELIE